MAVCKSERVLTVVWANEARVPESSRRNNVKFFICGVFGRKILPGLFSWIRRIGGVISYFGREQYMLCIKIAHKAG
jgi:hypothetical protein